MSTCVAGIKKVSLIESNIHPPPLLSPPPLPPTPSLASSMDYVHQMLDLSSRLALSSLVVLPLRSLPPPLRGVPSREDVWRQIEHVYLNSTFDLVRLWQFVSFVVVYQHLCICTTVYMLWVWRCGWGSVCRVCLHSWHLFWSFIHLSITYSPWTQSVCRLQQKLSQAYQGVLTVSHVV